MTASMTLAETMYDSRSLTQNVKKPARIRIKAIVIAAVAALAMISSTAAPAFADKRSDNFLKALAAIAAIGLISKAINDNNGKPQPIPTRRVPTICAIEFGSGRGMVRGFTEGCMRDEGFTYRLPRDCATNIRIYGRTDIFYSEQCLRDAGFNTRPR